MKIKSQRQRSTRSAVRLRTAWPLLFAPFAASVVVFCVPSSAFGQQTCSVKCPDGEWSDIRDCDSDDVPECLLRVYGAPQAPSVEVDRLRQKQQEEAAARQRAAADANDRGVAALNRGD